LPDVPTLAELGIPVAGGNWFGLFGPARMPEAAVRRIAEVAVEAVRTPAVAELYRNLAAEPVPSSPEALRAWVAAERRRWGEVIRALNIQLE
jgi:tripartite-type tricarboxylate transporter receptor subunit TctC